MQVHRATTSILAAGATPVLVGNGAPSFIAGFRDRVGYTGEVYTDPHLTLHRALELERSKRSSVNLRTIRSALAALRAGFRQASVQGDAWQQGGVFVIAPSGRVAYGHRSAFAGDHPDMTAVCDAVRAAARGGAASRASAGAG